jgi:galactokinase
MVQSHDSLRDDYEVSTPELDYLVETATGSLGCYGSRMTGGGFGGCTVSLVQPKHAAAFADEVKAVYKKKYRVDAVAFVTAATDGASVIV